MQSNTKFAVMDEALQFLSQEWTYARLKPNTATISSDDKTLTTAADDDTVTKSESSNDIATTRTTPTVAAAAAKPTASSLHQPEPITTITDTSPVSIDIPVPDLILPSETTPYDSKEFYKTGCIMAMLLNEHRQAPVPPAAGAPPRELIVTTTWKGADEEKDRAEKAAHRAWVMSGAAACEGLAASRWHNAAPAERDQKKKKQMVQKKKTARTPLRASHQSCNAPGARPGLAASRWCTV